MKDNIYIYKWRGIKTGWDYLLAVYRADSSELADTDILDPSDNSQINSGNTNIKTLPYGCYDVKKLEMEYEKYPCGLPATPVLEVKWYMDNVPNTADYDDFESAVFNPYIQVEGEVPIVGEA